MVRQLFLFVERRQRNDAALQRSDQLDHAMVILVIELEQREEILAIEQRLELLEVLVEPIAELYGWVEAEQELVERDHSSASSFSFRSASAVAAAAASA